MAVLSGKLTKNLVRTLGPGRHGDGSGLYLVVDPSGARRWIVRFTVKGQRNREGKPLRTDFGLGGADVVTLNEARDRALEYRRLAKQGINPRYNGRQEIPCFEEIARQVHIERLPTWKNPKHGQQWINTLAEYAFPKIGRLPVSEVGQPEVLQVLLPVWTEKHETAKRLAQRIKAVLDVAKSKGFRMARTRSRRSAMRGFCRRSNRRCSTTKRWTGRVYLPSTTSLRQRTRWRQRH